MITHPARTTRKRLAAVAVSACSVAGLAWMGTASAQPSTPDSMPLSAGQLTALVAPPGLLPRTVRAGVFGPMSALYETDLGVRLILGGSATMQGLPWLFRIEPSTSGPDATLGAGNTQRMVKVSGSVLASQGTAAAMAGLLRGAINRTCTTPAGVSTCVAHRVLVFVGSWRAGGGGAPPRRVGQRLREAMGTLSREAAPWGGSYAGRVYFALAPGPATSVAAGFGTNRVLGRNGKPIRRNYRAAFGAMALGGGVWIQMYHYSRANGLTGFTPAEWRDVPTGVTGFLGATRPSRDPLTYVHFMLTNVPGGGAAPGDPCSTPGVPGGPTVPGIPACAPAPTNCVVLPWRNLTVFPAYGRSLVIARARVDRAVARRAAGLIVPVNPGTPQVIRQPQPSPMACQWSRAQSGAVNTRLLMNGPGAYALSGEQATTWGRLFRQFFMVR